MNKKNFTAEIFKSDDLVSWAYKNEAIIALCYDVRGIVFRVTRF